MKVKIKWFQNNGVRERVCYLDKSNSTIRFANVRGLDLKRLKLEDFRRQRWIYFQDGSHSFLIRYSDMVSMEFLKEG